MTNLICFYTYLRIVRAEEEILYKRSGITTEVNSTVCDGFRHRRLWDCIVWLLAECSEVETKFCRTARCSTLAGA